MKKIKNSRLSTDSRKLQTLALNTFRHFNTSPKVNQGVTKDVIVKVNKSAKWLLVCYTAVFG